MKGWASVATATMLVLSSTGGVAAPQSAPPGDAYARDIQPLITKYCAKCHGEKPKPKADLNLLKFTSETSIRENRKLWKDVLLKVQTHEMPPEDFKPQPEAKERQQFTEAVSAALTKVDPKAPVDPGRVTARRLNRTEYGNTVRDLTGIDFDPAEDFPSDDVGHGFDNIGDVLTLPPVLMERYLAAAETIVQRCFPAEPPKPLENHQASKYLEPAGPHVPQSKFRPIKAEKGDGVRTGPLHKEYRVDAQSEYSFRFRAYAKGAPVKVALLACGKDVPGAADDAAVATLSGAALASLRPFRIVETFEIPASEEKESKKYQAKIPAMPGVTRLAVALLKGEEGKPVPEVWIESFVFSGPLDPRPAFQRRTMASVEGKPRAEQTREILKRFATRAFRRPISDVELARLVKLVEATEAKGQKWEAGMQLALEAVLVSPKFLFRLELDERPGSAEPRPLGDYALASRLSYFLWNTMPDDELVALAAKGALQADLENQVRRMLKDPRSRTLVDNFAIQWLQLKRINFISPDGALFPSFNQRLRHAMLEETERFIDAVFREDRSIIDLIDADFTFLNERLARHYGIADTNGNKVGQKAEKPGAPIRGEDFVRVNLQGGERGGLITQASVLTVTSNPTRTSPVKRGRWVLEQILGTPPPPPPPNVPELEESPKSAASGSLRQRMEQHRANPACANCHTRMDAIGFALENYNAVGGWRAKDGNFDIDATGTFPDGTSFKGFPELRKVLVSNKDAFARALAERMLIYAIGRGMEVYDDRALDRIRGALAKNGYKFSTLVVEIAKSDPFRLRRGKSVED